MTIFDRVRMVGKILAIMSQNRSQPPYGKAPGTIGASSLLFFYGDVHSQRGQDGILAEIFRRLQIETGQFVEFGAWDGIYLSNCRLLYEKGWQGVFIEADAERYKSLLGNYDNEARCIHAVVGTKNGLRLIDLLTLNDVDPKVVTFVSIDVDGQDLEIFATMGFTPPVVLVEGGFSFSPYLNKRMPDEVAAQDLQQPLPVICDTAKKVGYVPVCFCQDTYFVRRDLAAPFHAADPITLYAEAFRFMPIDFRENLIRFRQQSRAIRECEQEFFGYFSADPLGYS